MTAVGLGAMRLRCVRVVFMDCESGSGAFWARRTSRWASAVRSRFGMVRLGAGGGDP